jgi:hypothetical protein
MGLQSQVIPVNELHESQIVTMLRIMQTYYLNVDAGQFRADLKEKDRVILLYENRTIRGFSTWMLTQYEIDERTVNIIFSGDTIIEKDHWNSMALPIAWGHLMLATLTQNPDRELYWLLTSKGYKTYRFLPVFFRKFYPSFAQETPAFEKALLDSFANHKFGNRFNPLTGIMTASDASQRLVPGVADITESRRNDRHVHFFEKMNPGHVRGDELVCLASCRPDNINPFIMRYLQR